MVTFTKDSIVITVKSVESPFQDWQMINRSLSGLLMLIMSNEDFPVHAYETFWFVELKSALSELNISYEQGKQIEKLLAVA
ncbi:hypothetical protein [Flectobacillus major]|uniref:hypothetical protein n=1 Tax=Flectobacillus major TaxID=103 RepID=UPI0004070D75|nr:hypothetical protein [Flectobacillus major]